MARTAKWQNIVSLKSLGFSLSEMKELDDNWLMTYFKALEISAEKSRMRAENEQRRNDNIRKAYGKVW